LTVLHTLSNKTGGEEENDEAGEESNGKEAGNGCDRITLARNETSISIYILIRNRERVGESKEAENRREMGRSGGKKST